MSDYEAYQIAKVVAPDFIAWERNPSKLVPKLTRISKLSIRARASQPSKIRASHLYWKLVNGKLYRRILKQGEFSNSDVRLIIKWVFRIRHGRPEPAESMVNLPVEEKYATMASYRDGYSPFKIPNLIGWGGRRWVRHKPGIMGG